MRLFLACMLTLSFAVPAASAVAEEDGSATPTIYKWIDENGVAHYTTDVDRIPRSLRKQVDRAESGAAPAAQPAGVPSAPRATGRSEGLPQIAPVSEAGFGRDARPDIGVDVSAAGDTDQALDRVADLDAKIARLEEQIATDEAILTGFVTESSAEVGSGDEEANLLRDLGDRLPRLLAELEALRTEREALAP
jgi:hypothetical protein